MAAPGSHMERLRVLRAMRDLAGVSGGTDDPQAGMRAIQADVDIDDLIRPRLRTDDGSDVDEVLAQLSADEFDATFNELLGGLLASPVPPESAAGSEDGEKETGSTSPSG